MRKKIKRNWQFLLQRPLGDKFVLTIGLKEFADVAKREYDDLLHKDDYVWISPAETSFLVDHNVINLILYLFKNGIISDLKLPIEVFEEDDGVKSAKISYYTDDGAALDAAMKNPAQFKKSLLRFKMKDWPKFNEMCEKLDRISDNTFNRISFDETSGKIVYQQKESTLPLKKIEYYIAKALFEKPPETKFTEDDLVKYFDPLSSKADSPSRVYDAVLRINRRAKEDLGIEKLIDYKRSHFWLNKSS